MHDQPISDALELTLLLNVAARVGPVQLAYDVLRGMWRCTIDGHDGSYAVTPHEAVRYAYSSARG